MTATDLMARYCDGDASAFRKLHAIVAPRLFGYLVKMTRDRTRAADLVQQTFLKLHHSRHGYVAGADPVPWIYSIAHRTFIDEFRRRRASPERPAGGHEAAAPPSEEAQHEARLSSVFSALAELPATQREAVVLTKLEGHTFEEAAVIAGATPGAMRVRAHRGYEALRTRLVRDGDEA